MKKHYLKNYQYGAALAHFIAQASPHAQPLLSVALDRERPLKPWLTRAEKAKVGWVRGASVSRPELHKPDLRRYKYRIIDQLAETIVDHLRLGVVHGDFHLGNIILTAPRARQRRRAQGRMTARIGREMLKGVRYRRVALAKPIWVKVVDYERAVPLFADMDKILEKRPPYLRHVDAWNDYERVRSGILWQLAKNPKETRMLEEYFERKFLEMVEKL